jgi:arylsulfatase
MVQKTEGTADLWTEPFTVLRAPWIFNLRMDPYERSIITSNTYWDWVLRHAFVNVPVQDVVAKFVATFKDYPPRQKPSSFTIGDALKKLQEGIPEQ